MSIEQTPIALIGAGPIGLEIAVELKRAGLEYLQFDKGQIASTIAWFPPDMTFFSSTDRIGIAGVPIQTTNQSKCSKEQYLAYLRSICLQFDLPVRTHTSVTQIKRLHDEAFELTTQSAKESCKILAQKVILATGDMAAPRLLHIPGEELPHVSHYFHDPHTYFRKRVLIVGGKNSAVEAALRCYHAGADVTLCHRGADFDADHIKYWLLPELLGRIDRGEIICHRSSRLEEITPHAARLATPGGDILIDLDFALLMTGYIADMTLFEQLGVALTGEGRRPALDESTMQTSLPGLYVAGTATAGTQRSFRVFIENCHVHAQRIVAHLLGKAPPPDPVPNARPES